MELLNEIWNSAKRNKLRTALTGTAVAWGIFMLIVLLGAGNGLINATMSSSGRFLDNSMLVGGGQTAKAYDGLKEGRTITLDDRDLQTTSTRFTQNIDDVGASMSQQGVTITFGENYVSSELSGVYPNEAIINKKEMLCGRFVNDIDNKEQRKSLVLSENQAKELYNGDIASLVGKYAKVGEFSFCIVGIYKSDQSRMNSEAFTAFSTFRTMYNRGDKADHIIFSFHGLNSIKENDDFESNYKAALNTNHRAAPDDEESVWIWNRFKQNLQMNMSGIVGVSNIMLITVKERTREFGIRKAIGAKPSAILRLIIAESIIITTIFGYIGMIMGIAANMYMDATLGHQKVSTGLFEATMFVNPTVGIDVCIEATLVMIIAGTLAGLAPARKAARIRPIEALRAE